MFFTSSIMLEMSPLPFLNENYMNIASFIVVSRYMYTNRDSLNSLSFQIRKNTLSNVTYTNFVIHFSQISGG